MKKYFRLFVALLLVVLLTPFAIIPAKADLDPTVTVADIFGAAGTTVDVEIGLANNPGVICVQLTVEYDSTALELVAVNDTGLLPGAIHTPSYSEPYTLTWLNGTAAEDFKVNGTVAALSFKIKETAAKGDVYSITVSYDYENYEIYNFNFEPIAFAIQNGSITVGCPHTNTTDVPEEPADCDEGGFTAGVWCNDCETYISGHEPTPATGVHVDEDAQWEHNEDSHFYTCSCGYVFASSSHTGGTANCKEKAKCSVCGEEYGQVDYGNHVGETITVNAVEADHKTQQNGYTGDIKCLGCDVILEYGQEIPAGNHSPDEKWATDSTHHWKECFVSGCGTVIEGTKEAHFSTGSNVATAQTKPVCDVCGVTYGKAESADFILGDINGDTNVDIHDAILLFQHSMVPDLYPINYAGNIDFTRDGTVDLSDAVLLFQYSMVPDLYPIG